MKEKILQSLKQSYSHLGLGDAVLSAFSEMLDATGVVTEETLADVVAKQHTALEAIQKSNDKRAADAAAKAAKEAEAKAKAEAEKQAREAEAEREKQAEAEKQTENENKEAESRETEEIPSWFKAQQAAFEKRMQEAITRNEELSKSLQAVKDENDKFRSEQAAAERSAFIASEAKRLGVPEWRSNEGFNIAADADKEAITEYLTKVSNNVKANMLPENKPGFPQFSGKATAEEIETLAKSILK